MKQISKYFFFVLFDYIIRCEFFQILYKTMQKIPIFLRSSHVPKMLRE